MSDIPEGQICEQCREFPAVASFETLNIATFVPEKHFMCRECYDEFMEDIESYFEELHRVYERNRHHSRK